MSYTTFAYSNLTLDRNNVADEDTVTVTVDVTNTGSVKGKEIVQLYVSDLTGAARRPLRELKGYEKVSLKPGETKTVSFTLDYRSFAWYHTALHDWYAASGEYEIQIGASSRDIRLSEIVHLITKKLLPIQTHLNTTLGELLSDERTAKYGLKLKKKWMLSLAAAQNPMKIRKAQKKQPTKRLAMLWEMPLHFPCRCEAYFLSDFVQKRNYRT